MCPRVYIGSSSVHLFTEPRIIQTTTTPDFCKGVTLEFYNEDASQLICLPNSSNASWHAVIVPLILNKSRHKILSFLSHTASQYGPQFLLLCFDVMTPTMLDYLGFDAEIASNAPSNSSLGPPTVHTQVTTVDSKQTVYKYA